MEKRGKSRVWLLSYIIEIENVGGDVDVVRRVLFWVYWVWGDFEKFKERCLFNDSLESDLNWSCRVEVIGIWVFFFDNIGIVKYVRLECVKWERCFEDIGFRYCFRR